jgi:signal transduction histidine kinase
MVTGWHLARRSLAIKLVAASLAVEVAMLSALVFTNIRTANSSLATQTANRVAEINVLLNASLAVPLVARDQGALQDVLGAIRRHEGLEYLALTDSHGRLMAISGWPDTEPLPALSQGAPNGTDGIWNNAIPITLAGQTYGRLHYGLSTAFFSEVRRSMLRFSLTIAAAEVILSAAFLSLVGFVLTRRLRAVTRTSEAIAAGNLNARARIVGNDDEVDRLGRGFNAMAETLATHLQELRHEHEALEKANAELLQFANISAHHLMEPSRRQLAFAQRLRAKLEAMAPDDDARASLAFIEEGAARMRDLVRDVERYLTAGMPRGLPQGHATEAALDKARARLARLVDECGARFEIRDLPPVHLDLPRLTDLFEMLIENALVHARAGAPPVILLSGERLGSSTRIRIEDNGPGIPEKYRERVFGVFERLSANPRAGTGIGLAIARRMVESRGGAIWVETSQLGGAAMVFDIPDEGSKLEV